MYEGLAPGWIKWEMLRNSSNPGDPLGGLMESTVQSDDIFVSEEPLPIDTTLTSAKHYVSTFTFTPDETLDSCARVILGFYRIASEMGDEYNNSVYIEMVTMFYERNYNMGS
jgi:hypothetical protein